MTGNHLMLLLFRSVLSVLSVCRDRCRVQQGCFIGNTIDIRFYRLSFFIGRIGVCPIPANNECVPRKRCCELDHISILLNPVVYVYQGRSTFWFGALHEGRNIYPAMIWLHLKLEVRPIRTCDCAGFVSTLWISVKYILPWKKNSSSDRPCLNKAFLSSFPELSNLCKCLCHS